MFVGDFGSGKTEVAVNFALALATLEPDVRLADLDMVNPYFRSREALDLLEQQGVGVITPRGEYLTSELPIMLPEVKGALQSGSGRLILDVGGDDLGARVLSSLHGSWSPATVEVLLVVNANRPFTDSVEGVCKVLGKIEQAARMPVTGLVSNTHLMEWTTPAEIERGIRLCQAVADLRAIPLRFVAIMQELFETEATATQQTLGDLPRLPMVRIMAPPWGIRVKLGPQGLQPRRAGQAGPREPSSSQVKE